MGAILGADCKLYRNTGTYATPVWDLVDIVKDVTLNLEKGEADATTRANGGWKAIISGLKDASVEFDIIWDSVSTDFTAFKDSFFNDTPVELAIMDGDIATNGSSGLRSSMETMSFSRSEPLEEAVSASVKCKPAYSANPPAWMVVST